MFLKWCPLSSSKRVYIAPLAELLFQIILRLQQLLLCHMELVKFDPFLNIVFGMLGSGRKRNLSWCLEGWVGLYWLIKRGAI